MRECICNSCKNLKNIFDENGISDEYECKFGFPSESCSICEQVDCELTCDNYISDEEEEKFVITKCKKCGKELRRACGNNEDGEVYCVDCFLE